MAHQFDRIDAAKTRISDTVFEWLARAIASGEYAPGERLRDTEIAGRLGVSRMPVREALLQLEREGLVEMSASRYTRVTALSQEITREALEFVSYQAAMATRVGVSRLDAEGVERALQLIDELLDAATVGDFEGLSVAIADCMAFVGEASGNRYIARSLEQTKFLMERNLRSTTEWPENIAGRADVFKSLRAAVIARDGILIEQGVLALSAVGTGNTVAQFGEQRASGAPADTE